MDEQKRNIWIEHFKSLTEANSSEPTIERMKNMLSIVGKYFHDTEKFDDHERLQLLSIAIQLRTSIAMLNKLEDIERTVRDIG